MIFYRCLLAVVAIAIGVSVTEATANAQQSWRLEQYISPIECSENKVDNGIEIVTILTPEECQEFLHPTPKPDTQGGTQQAGVKQPQPGAPNTGFFASMQSFVSSDIGIIFLLSLTIVAVAVTIRRIYVYFAR